jgi:hypothetical protein
MKLYFFDIKTKNWDKIDMTRIIEEKLKWNIDQFEKEYGIKIKIVSIKNAEYFIQHYYQNLGYIVFRLEYYSNNFNEKEETIIQLLSQYEKDEKQIRLDLGLEKKGKNNNGIPDFLIFKDKEIFFVEAKSWQDGLRGNQLTWIFSHNYPVKIFVQKGEYEPENLIRKNKKEEEDLLLDENEDEELKLE